MTFKGRNIYYIYKHSTNLHDILKTAINYKSNSSENTNFILDLYYLIF